MVTSAETDPALTAARTSYEATGDSAEEEKITALAKLSGLAYLKQCRLVAKDLGIRAGELDKLVRQCRKRAKEDSALPHWKVEPSQTAVKCAALLDVSKTCSLATSCCRKALVMRWRCGCCTHGQ
jgi:hypothetical protein